MRFSRIDSFACQLSRICRIFAAPSFGTSESRADWYCRTCIVSSPNVATMRWARTGPMPLMRPEAR